jgi:hypothetical protein
LLGLPVGPPNTTVRYHHSNGRFQPRHYMSMESTTRTPTHTLHTQFSFDRLSNLWFEFAYLTVCFVVEPRERSGTDPLPRLFGWGAVGAERLQEEYTCKMRVGSVR